MMIRSSQWTALLLGAAVAALLSVGCHRSFYREQADLEAYDLITEKSLHPHWDLDQIGVYPGPESRMASPDNPDCPAMPPDDPVAHGLMHYVDDKNGWPFWDLNGQTMFVENPQWQAFLPVDENGVLRLDSESAVKLAILHSPDYQSQVETLYLSALDVSAERFAFDPQAFGGYEVQYDAFGRLHPSSGGGSSSVFEASTRNVQVRRLFTTGAELVAGLANSLIWQFAGDDTHTASTLLNFSLVQPLLQGAGRDVIMESLTLAERNLLYGVRQMERYRRGFYLDIVMGNGSQSGPSRGASALSNNFGASGTGAGGLLGLLQTQLSIRNQEANLDALRSSLTQLEALSRKGAVDFFQVDQTRSTVTRQTTSLLDSKRSYRDRLDTFKRSLGLPPTLDVVIDDDSLDVVQLTDPKIRALQDQVKELRLRVSKTNIAILEELRKEAAFGWSPELEANLRLLRSELAELDALCLQILNSTAGDIRDEIEQLRAVLPKRKAFTEKMRALIALAKQSNDDSLLGDVDLSIFNVDQLYGLRKLYEDQTQREISLDELPAYLEDWLDKTTKALETIIEGNAGITATLDGVLTNGPNMDSMQLRTVVDEQIQKPNPDQFNLAEAGTIDLLLISALARAESLILPEVELTPEEAVEIARLFRRDWMNARAALIDAWRLIQFNANDLESVLDIVFTGELRNTGDNPLRLRDAAGSLGVGVQFDAPLTRLLERNTYRETLIRYAAARRAFYQIEDAISQSMRSILRRVEFSQVDFEVQRTALRVAVAQVRSARAAIEQPPRPGEVQSLGPTTSLNLINALSSLNSAQDSFIGVWVNYQVQRGLLDLQMGTMTLNEEGIWIDPGPIGPKLGYPADEDLQLVPEYTHGFPSLDDLLYERTPQWLQGPESIPTPQPDPNGLEGPLPQMELELPPGANRATSRDDLATHREPAAEPRRASPRRASPRRATPQHGVQAASHTVSRAVAWKGRSEPQEAEEDVPPAPLPELAPRKPTRLRTENTLERNVPAPRVATPKSDPERDPRRNPLR